MPLENLEKELQEIAEAIMSVTGLDVTILDGSLKRIAGTGKYYEKIGKYVAKNSVFEKCIKTGKQYVITEPRTCEECVNCSGKQNCREEAEVCYPIESDSGIAGVIGMIAFSPEQKEAFIKNRLNYMNFVSRMSKLIASSIKEKILHQELQYKSIELKTIIDSVDEGIIAIGDDRKILCINNWTCRMFDINAEDVVGEDIDEILPGNGITKILKTNNEIKDQEEIINVNGKSHRFLLSAKPIIFKHKAAGVVASLKDFNKLRRSIFKISENPETFTFDKILGSSPAFTMVKEQARQIASQDITVLLLGESGTGKELFARAIHHESLRRHEIFLPINCGAIPDSLIESELFGYEKGTFTGANPKGKVGKFESANGGTIFLDEIGDLPLHMQVKILRVLQEKEIYRVGGVLPIKVDVRIIAATNKDLQAMVQRGEFREDLFYRLNVVPIKIPPLREHPEDILELAKAFFRRYTKIYHKNLKGISKEAKKILLNYTYPGNVRELENLIEYGIIFEKSEFLEGKTILKKIGVGNTPDTAETGGLKEMVARYEKQIIEDLMRHYGETTEAKQKIAKKLNISTATLYRKLRELDLTNQ
ncbi:PAS modulated sigma54 specific transcriptional regulator, Fis family [Tepidanaerobacter acetatoxydans Re1]|uniref:PAS modulated sigma54 specific transcriptional regulator, Fis family n=1 Tax=Tepidanaerobacter acetatoxydans (strain DSM 21804 / JCM 16047 / Re1) TaxID=1209989 RepID=F4LUK3_TEPAE|nr:sigma 54-interacting transcriptional regulator [Tepidanaerobacter acetatoxydans]AEE92648.1 PAS modulated sigma54 specific transcriptional regulator, Fis family [Tepidanaerobacter acetatoxydans Re1]CDI41066.1 PAS modulated sigma54 specific transcriptional regulator, Fis family [Tepidanaerobacter acetatoxydans Re1]